MNDAYTMVCESCKHNRCNDSDVDTCRKARIYRVAPEGVKVYRDVDSESALSNFRSEYGGRCPHYKKSIIFRILDLFT